PVPAGVVDDDEVRAAGLGALGGQPGPGPGPDDRPPVPGLGPQPVQHLRASHGQLSPSLVWPALLAAVIIRCSSSAIAVANTGSFRCALTRCRLSPAALSSASSA